MSLDPLVQRLAFLRERREFEAAETADAVYPVLLGTGKRVVAEGTPPRSFELVRTQALPSGIIFSTFKVAGPLKTG